MDYQNQNTPVPPLIPPADDPSSEPPLGTDPVEKTPIAGVMPTFEALLRQPRRVMFQLTQQKALVLIIAMAVIAVFYLS